MRNIRYKCYGDDTYKMLEEKYGSKKKSENMLQFNYKYSDNKGHQRLVGFSREELFGILRNGKLKVHVDATFKCTPPGYLQTLIVSVRDNQTELHTPVFFVLMTTKMCEADCLTYVL